jgi:endonuclease/exonuclease/phosphatase family metal-dependent hydrolase
MKLASYNVENLFDRPVAMDQATWAAGADTLKNHAELNQILGKAKYTAADKNKIIALLKALKLEKSDSNKLVILRQNRGHLVKRPRNGGLQVVADGRGDWIGWLDLQREAVNEVATRMTARVIDDLAADVLGVVEAENRPSLLRFCDDVLPTAGSVDYAHVMLIDGNDSRGIDVGLMTRNNYDIGAIHSHVDDTDNVGVIFSRDCAQYDITTPQGNEFVLLINHFKSKGFGSQASSNAKRERQATRVKAIYEQLRQDGIKHIAVIGDFNDTPDSGPIKPLTEQTDLKDISEHANFDDGGRPGTFGNGTKSGKIDYILLSPDLFAKTSKGGIFRMGVWGGTHGTLFPHYPEITKEAEAASDHAAIWAEIDI